MFPLTTATTTRTNDMEGVLGICLLLLAVMIVLIAIGVEWAWLDR